VARTLGRYLVAGGTAILTLVALAALAEGGATAWPASADAGGDATTKARIPPDPPALRERMQWVFDLRWERDEIYLLQIHKLDMGEPHVTPRVMGRFALELYEGPTLIERVRFDFPLLGEPLAADAGRSRWTDPVRIEPGLKTRIGVVFPATTRGTRLELWDRATDRRWPLPWPPTEGTYGPGPRDGG
jgi:hypothetical protein